MFVKSSSIIKDGLKLSYDYVPKKLVGREEQISTLEMLFSPVAHNGVSEFAFVFGPVGSGKTATVKRFCSDMSDYCHSINKRMDYVFVNCRQKATESGVLLQLIRHYDSGFPDRGYSVPEMYRTLMAQIKKNATALIVVLDEADILLRQKGNLVYLLSRTDEELSVSNASVSLILISQEHILDRLDDASRSSFKRANTVRFPKYGKEELFAIVESRATEALIPGTLDSDATYLIADIASEFGDARIAIELLDKSARIAETGTLGIVTAEDVRRCNDLISSDIAKTKLESLNENHLLVLLAVCRSIKNKASVTLAAAEKTYAVVCEEYERQARKHTQFWSYVQFLERTGFVSTSMIPDEGGGRIKTIMLRDIPSKTLASMIEDLME